MTGPPQCAIGEVPFSSVLVSANPAGLPIVNLASTIDGTLGSDLSGFSPPVTEAQLVANPTTAFDYVFAAPVDGLSRLRWWNGGGGVLTDQDGFGLINVTFLDAGLLPIGASVPWDVGPPAADNNPARELNFHAVSGVARVRFDGFHKQNVAVMGTGSPLLRQVEAFNFQTVFPCRRRNGTLEWYDQQGNLVNSADVVSCEQPPQPFVMPDLHMLGAAFGDDPSGTAENLCNVVPAPSAVSGWAAPVGGCYDPVSGAPTMDWVSTSSVEMSYDDNGNGAASGGVIVQFTSTLGGITWPTNLTNMAPGDQRNSNPFGGGHRAVLTYVSGPPQSSASGTIRMEGGTSIGLHRLNVSNVAAIRFRLDFINA